MTNKVVVNKLKDLILFFELSFGDIFRANGPSKDLYIKAIVCNSNINEASIPLAVNLATGASFEFHNDVLCKPEPSVTIFKETKEE